MSGKAAKGRAAPVTALLSLLLFAGACEKAPVSWEYFLADAAGNRLGTSLPAGQAARAVYRPDKPTVDQIAFQLFFRGKAGGWEVLSLVVEKPETPAPEVACDLHAEDLPPGSYLVVLIRNDEELSKLVFTIAPPAGTGEQARGRKISDKGASPVSPRAKPTPKSKAEELGARRVTPTPKSKVEELGAPNPTPESNVEEFLDSEAMPTPESNVEGLLDPEGMPTPGSLVLAGSEAVPLPSPEPEALGPGAWDLSPGTEVLVFSEADGYWYPASIIRTYGRVFTVRYFNPEYPDEDLERENFRVQALTEGMEVKIHAEGNELIDAVIVSRQGRNCSVAMKADGHVRDVACGAIVVASP